MGLFRKVISVKPNEIAYLYKRNKLQKVLNPGIYKLFDFNHELDVVLIPSISRLITISNQEVMTKDNISLRLSYILNYQITDGNIFINNFNILNYHNRDRSASLIAEAENIVHSYAQVYLRLEIAQVESLELNSCKQNILNHIPEGLAKQLNDYGISIHQLIVKDIYFPKMIQQLFARQLEAKMRAKLDLENARTVVATARTLRNAAELIKNNENIKFIQYLETISKIATQGKHTFVIGDLQDYSSS